MLKEESDWESNPRHCSRNRFLLGSTRQTCYTAVGNDFPLGRSPLPGKKSEVLDPGEESVRESNTQPCERNYLAFGSTIQTAGMYAGGFSVSNGELWTITEPRCIITVFPHKENLHAVFLTCCCTFPEAR